MSRLCADSITKSFGGKQVLSDIYLGCETGTVTALLGRNGTGKSTLLKIIFGTVKGDSQYIRVDDKILQNQTDRKGRIAYLPQYSFLPKGIKIKNLIPLFCNQENAGKLLALELLKPLLNETCRNLSGGEKRIAETLLILYSDSKFILLDEPFSGLSPKLTSEMQRNIKKQAEHKGIVISDHYFQDVLDISDEVYLLSGSHLKQIKNLKELEQHNYLPKSI